MGSLLIVTGPPGSGKSTVSTVLAERRERSVLVEGDVFFSFLAAGAIPPWLPESRAQNEIVGDASAHATRRFAADYDTVYDGVMGPWQLERFCAELGLATLDYVIVLPDVETCVNRVRTRTGHGFTDLDAARHMHAEFQQAVDSGSVDTRHVIDNGSLTVDAAVTEIERRRDSGQLRLDQHGGLPSQA